MAEIDVDANAKWVQKLRDYLAACEAVEWTPEKWARARDDLLVKLKETGMMAHSFTSASQVDWTNERTIDWLDTFARNGRWSKFNNDLFPWNRDGSASDGIDHRFMLPTLELYTTEDYAWSSRLLAYYATHFCKSSPADAKWVSVYIEIDTDYRVNYDTLDLTPVAEWADRYADRMRIVKLYLSASKRVNPVAVRGLDRLRHLMKLSLTNVGSEPALFTHRVNTPSVWPNMMTLKLFYNQNAIMLSDVPLARIMPNLVDIEIENSHKLQFTLDPRGNGILDNLHELRFVTLNYCRGIVDLYAIFTPWLCASPALERVFLRELSAITEEHPTDPIPRALIRRAFGDEAKRGTDVPWPFLSIPVSFSRGGTWDERVRAQLDRERTQYARDQVELLLHLGWEQRRQRDDTVGHAPPPEIWELMRTEFAKLNSRVCVG